MVDIKYANAYTEVLEILKYISTEDYNKIPKIKIELYETNANSKYSFTYDPDKTLNEQNVSKIAKGIIAILFRDYWATEEQRKKIIAKQNYHRQKLEDEKRKKYNSNDIFKARTTFDLKEVSDQNIVDNSNLPIEVKKQKVFQKIIIFIKKCLKLKDK